MLDSGVKFTEVTTAKRSKLAVVQGGDIRGAWQAADEGYFSEEIAGSQFNSSISDGDLNLTVDNEVKSIGFFAGPNDSLTRLGSARLEVKQKDLALFRGKAFENSGRDTVLNPQFMVALGFRDNDWDIF